MPFLAPVVAFLGTTAGATLAAGAVGAGAALLNGRSQSKAIQNASTAQQAGVNAGITEQQREFDANQTNLAPWLAAGKVALGGQMDLLGLGGHPAIAAGAPGGVGAAPGGQDWAGYLQANPDVMQEAQRVVADGEFPSPEAYAQYHFQNFGQGEGRTVPTLGGTPGAAFGGSPGSPAVDGATAQQQAIDQLQKSPLYQSLYRNGQNTILANGSATGGLRGGNIQRSLADFGADTLSTVIENQLQHLAGISGQGVSTGGTLGALNGQTATNISNLDTQGGAVRAGGILGSAAVGNAGLMSAIQQLVAGAGQSFGQYRTQQNSVGGNQPVLI